MVLFPQVNAKLPMSVNKFIEPAEMNAEAFFTRWKNLSLPQQVGNIPSSMAFKPSNIRWIRTGCKPFLKVILCITSYYIQFFFEYENVQS